MSHTPKKQLIAFLATGLSAAITHFLVLLVCVHLLTIEPAIANIIAFLCAFCISYLGHRTYTFSEKQTRISPSLLRWFITSVCAFIVNQSLFMLGLYLFGSFWYLLIWFACTAIVTVMTFLLAKYWAFKQRGDREV